MKKEFTIVLFIAAVLISGPAYSQKGPLIGTGLSSWEFGDVKKSSIAEKIFSVENSGDETLVIQNVSSCCGYGVVDVSEWEMEPGESSMIKVSCDSSRKTPGRDEKKVVVRSNSVNFPVLEIPVTCNVVD
ncbi:MAG TPA: DUF1573 domain-containing protein [Candidatus Omnitrophota bacterium]|nr:DUF1573 domain-containing protein [Candidatus Omnitrophota bacterium]